MSMNDFQAKVLMELQAIREQLASTPSSGSSSKTQKKERKPRDPTAKPNDWIVFTGRVRAALKAADLPAGKECQQFASHLKTVHSDAYNMTDEEIIAARNDWNAPPAKPKEKDGDTKPTSDTDAKPKPKRTLTQEQKDKMAAGRKAAAERKKAEKDAETVAKPVAQEQPKSVSTPESKSVPTPQPTLRPLPFKGKKYLWDPASNGLWIAEKDGSRGAWAGVLASDRKSIDATAPNPEDVDGDDA